MVEALCGILKFVGNGADMSPKKDEITTRFQVDGLKSIGSFGESKNDRSREAVPVNSLIESAFIFDDIAPIYVKSILATFLSTAIQK